MPRRKGSDNARVVMYLRPDLNERVRIEKAVTGWTLGEVVTELLDAFPKPLVDEMRAEAQRREVSVAQVAREMAAAWRRCGERDGADRV